MEHLEIILILLAVIAGLAPLADKIKLPFPVALVIVGLLIGFIPGLPGIKLDPEVVFLVFLPPLLYEAAFNTSWKDIKAERRTILFLSVRMVFFTAAVLAVIIHYLVPGFTWTLAIILGAIISPTDAVAVTAATKGLRLPRKVVTAIEGESLLNDASALIIYRYAIAVVISGTLVSWKGWLPFMEGFWKGWLQFMIVTTGGILIGLVIGYAFSKVQKWLAGNPVVEISLTLLVGYVAYLVGDNLHTSGVLAVVTTGLFISWRSFDIFSYRTRLQMNVFWQILIFLLNGFIFILIGLQLPSIIKGIGSEHLLAMTGYGLLISGAAILFRPLVLIPASYVHPQGMKLSKAEMAARRRELIVISWSGMRGVVSLATALAVPLTMAGGKVFPHRDEILFLTFMVILVTLLVQGLTFPYIVWKLNVREEDANRLEQEQQLRTEMIHVSIAFIDDNLSNQLDKRVLDELRVDFTDRLNYVKGVINTDDPAAQFPLSKHDLFQEYLEAELKILHLQRDYVINMHKRGLYGEEILHKLEQELDVWNMSLNTRMQSVQANVIHI